MEYDSTYDMSTQMTTDPATSAAVAGASVFFFFLIIILAIAMYAITALLMSRIFKKAGVESWKAWVPVYNMWNLLELGGQKGWWAILALIPVVNIVSAVFMYIAMYNVGLKLGKEGVFVLWAIFLPIVWYIWLAVDKSTWNPNAPGQVAVTATTTPAASPTPPPAQADPDTAPTEDDATPPTPPTTPKA